MDDNGNKNLKHEKTKKILKIVGPVVALCWLGLAIM